MLHSEPERERFYLFCKHLAKLAMWTNSNRNDSVIQLAWKNWWARNFTLNKIILMFVFDFEFRLLSYRSPTTFYLCKFEKRTEQQQQKQEQEKTVMSAIWHFVHVADRMRGSFDRTHCKHTRKGNVDQICISILPYSSGWGCDRMFESKLNGQKMLETMIVGIQFKRIKKHISTV